MQAAWIILIVAIAIVSIAWQFGRSGSMLDRWARENGYEILDQEYRSMFRGPFFWTTGKGQAVYYVTVRDRSGQIRRAWVRCGGWFLGLLSDRVDVRWDDRTEDRANDDTGAR